jgi:flavodoxin
MKITIRYQSRGGNTKVVAEAIATVVVGVETAGVTAETLDVPISDPVDLLFIGGGVYAWDIDKSLKDFLNNLNPETVKSVAVFSTAGGMNGSTKIAAILKARGIPVRQKTLSIKSGFRNYGGGKGRLELSDKEKSAIETFVKQMNIEA